MPDNLEGNLREIKTNDDHNQFPKIDKGKYVLHPRNPNITHDFSDPILVHTNTAEAMLRRGMRYIFGGINPSISKIVEINYIENKALEDKFMAKKEELQAQNKDTSELLLFHGTSYASTHSICESNFNLDVLGRSYYGRGIYFSRCPNMSLCFGKDLILCRVLPGRKQESKYTWFLGTPTSKLEDGFDILDISKNAYSDTLVVRSVDQILPYCIIRTVHNGGAKSYGTPKGIMAEPVTGCTLL